MSTMKALQGRVSREYTIRLARLRRRYALARRLGLPSAIAAKVACWSVKRIYALADEDKKRSHA